MTEYSTELGPFDEYNQALLDNVHPPSWPQPQALGRYNLVVIGGGTAGLVSAAGAAGLGARVALIEREFLGGDCLNYGCVPSKAIIRAARVAETVRTASRYGVRGAGDFSVDFAQVMERMRRLRSEISKHDSAQRLRGLGIDVFLGDGKFDSPNSLSVDGRKLQFSRAIIATGTRAAYPPIPGLQEAGFLTNETLFSLTELPRRLSVIGAGPIGCEMAQAFRRLGSEVCLITRGAGLLPKEDRDAAAVLEKRFKQEGIRVVPNATIGRVELVNSSKVVVLEVEGERLQVESDLILVAVGRTPNLENLDLVRAGVTFDGEGVTVDDHLRTTNARVYAAGDICSRFKFTHTADAMARLALRNALFFGRGKASSLVIPWCTFTDPEVAHVGITSEGAGKMGGQVVTYNVNLTDVDRAVLDGETEGFARVHVSSKSGRILGATLVSEHAGETIAEFVLAMGQKIPLTALSSTIHPYPTQAEAVKKLGDLSMRARLKPWVRELFVRYFKVWR
jgi:pyruvate/2-oxoglutarate dehydrogenase complex dihydrolipoamide dehydrogenase (E3) component